jgi:hypothetical protein
MPQHDYVISDADGLSFLADLNLMCAAVVGFNSGASAPAVTYAYMPWVDTSSGIFKQRNAANSAWINLFTLSTGNLAQIGGMTLTGEINTKRSTVAATATTTPLWAAGTGNVQDWTGTPTITNFPAATQAGASRVVYPAAGTIFTDNANIDVQGDANYTIVAGDKVYIEALTTTTFKIFVEPKAGNTIADATTTIKGKVELATTAEAALRNDTATVVTPEGLQGLIVSHGVVALSAQTSVDFTSIPSWARRITVVLLSISTNGTSVPIVQIGDSGGIEVTGYAATASVVSSTVSTAQFTTGFGISQVSASTSSYSGLIILNRIAVGSNSWLCSFSLGKGDSASTSLGGGSKTLSADLDRVRFTTVNGTDVLDAGFINIFYE